MSLSDWSALPRGDRENLARSSYTPGETHTLVVPDDTSDMITLFHVTGGYSYLDAQEQVIGFEDVFTKLAAARAHFEANGMPEEALATLIR